MGESRNLSGLKPVEQSDETPNADTTTSANLVNVKMFGGFSLYVAGQLVGDIAGRSATTLLAYLIYNRDRQHTRDLLIGQFWPDLDETKARRRLSNALWQIGSVCKAAGFSSILDRNKETVMLRPDLLIEADYQRFDSKMDEFENQVSSESRALDDPRVARELALVIDEYEDFLAGYYGAWIDFERDRLRNRYLDALAMLVRVFKSCGDHDAALRYARQLVTAEPTREESHREVIRLCGLVGHLSEAKRQYELCQETLRRDLGVEPAEETTDLLSRVERESLLGDLPIGQAAKAEPLLGRGQVLTDLLSRVEELMAGRGGVVLLEGEIGLGKTRLVSELSEGAQWRGAAVSLAAHNERSRWQPYGGLCEAIGPACSSLRGEHVAELLGPFWVGLVKKLMPQFGTGDDELAPQTTSVLKGDEERWRTAEALARVVLALGRLTPTVVILEDLQWADEEVMSTLKVLSRDLVDSGILLCLTYRRSEASKVAPVWETLGELNAAEGVTRCELKPLPPEHMKRFVDSRPGSSKLTKPAVEKLLNLVDGNPLFAGQILQQPDLLSNRNVSGTEMELAAADLMTKVVRSRVQAVGREVESILGLLAVLDEPAGSKQLSRLLGLPRQVVISELSTAVSLRFLTESVDGCLFVNKEIRRLVYQQMPDEKRRSLHGQVLNDMLDNGSETEQVLGYHAWHAQLWREAWKYYRRAARNDLTLHAYKTASDLFHLADQAASNLDICLADWFEDVMRYEDVLDTLSRRSEQGALLDRLAALRLDEVQRTEVELRKVRLLAHTSRHDESASVASSAIAKAKRSGRSCGEIRAYAGASLYWGGKPVEAIDMLTTAVAELNGAAKSSAEASIWLAKAHIDRQNFDDARAVLSEAALLAQPAENLRFEVDALAAKATIHSYQGDVDDAVRNYQESLNLSRRIGYLRGEAVNLVNLGSAYTLVSQGGAAVAAFDAASKLLPMLSDDRGQAFVDSNSADLCHRLLGDDERARTLASRAAVYFRSMEDLRMDALCLDVLARIDLRAGRRVRARTMLLDAAQREEIAHEPWLAVQIQAALCEVHLQFEDYEAVLSVADEALTSCEALSLNVLVPGFLATRALALVALERSEEATRSVAEAVDRNSTKASYAHLVAWRAAEVFAVLGDREQQGEQVQLAHQWLQLNLAGLSNERQDLAWRNVPEHAAIKQAYEQLVPVVECLRWPSASADDNPNPDQSVEVNLTLSSPDDWSLQTEVERRRQRIARVLAEATSQNAAPRVQDLAKCLDVSERTVKRDLATLRGVKLD